MIALGVVPDIHFSTLHLAEQLNLFAKHGATVRVTEFAGRTGEMARMLRDGEVDVGVGLTDGLVSFIAAGAGTKIIGTFVETPMGWVMAISTLEHLAITAGEEGGLY